MTSTAVNRRSVLALGAAAAAVAGIGVPMPAATGAPEVQGPLPRLDVSADQVAREVAGLRPFRPSGFVVRAEPFGNKTLIHNYGHGGCGVTLSWGTADMATKLALATPHREAAVIGCGVIGLTTARLLQDRGFNVTIYAAELPPNTTSNIAAGLFALTWVVDDAHHSGPIVGEIQQAVRFAHRYFQNFLGSERYGVRWMDLFLLGDHPMELAWDWAITPELFPLTMFEPGEHPFPSKYASRFPTMIAETDLFLSALISDFIERGGSLRVRAFAKPTALQALREPVIINCTGLGAKALFGDPELVPVKGQLTIIRPQPAVTYAYFDLALDLYMVPRRDGIVLGGSHGRDVWSTDIDPVLATQILESHALIMGGMKR